MDDDRLNIWSPYFTRSEYGPLKPLCDVARNIGVSYHLSNFTGKKDRRVETLTKAALRYANPDVVLCPFDRPEMARVASFCYHEGYPIAQIYAGDVAGGAHDDADRYAISMYSTYLFAADYKQYERLVAAMKWRQALDWHTVIECPGPTHFDDMNYDPPAVIDYALVLYNPPSLATDEQVEAEMFELCELLQNEDEVYWVAPNGDARSDIVMRYASQFHVLDSMPRDEFLGWLKYCHTFYGNSSSMFYEARYFDVPYRQVGMRNAYREPVSKTMCKPGASERILKTLPRELK